jgi:dihydrofolate reductase
VNSWAARRLRAGSGPPASPRSSQARKWLVTRMAAGEVAGRTSFDTPARSGSAGFGALRGELHACQRWGPGIGAEIMGRGKFGPHHGPWLDQEWNGWWGDDLPIHTSVFVLTHHLRPSVQMNGGTTFDFLDASPAQALAQARQAAAGRDIRVGGGPSTIREFLAAGLIDYVHIVVVPIVLGRGERLRDGLEALEECFRIEAANSPSGVTHVTLGRR